MRLNFSVQKLVDRFRVSPYVPSHITDSQVLARHVLLKFFSCVFHVFFHVPHEHNVNQDEVPVKHFLYFFILSRGKDR